MADEQNSKDPIERLFQKKAEEYDISFREEDWQKLEKRLEVRDAQLIYRKRLSRVAAAAVLIIGILGYFTYQNYIRIDELSQQLAEEAETEPSQDHVVEDIPEIESSIPAIDEYQLRPDSRLDEPIATSSAAEAGESIAVAADTAEYELFVAEVPVSSVHTSLPLPRGFSPVDETRPAMSAPVADEETHIAQASDPDVEEPFRSRFALSLAASPDVSSAGSGADMSSPGYRYGVTIEYKISSNLAISTGLVQSMVRYSAGPGDYSTPYGYSQGGTPDAVTGECLILDIPISVKYDFLNFDRSRFFATAGLTSYIMQQEDYWFEYDTADSYDQMDSWSGRTGTRHWFSNAQLSLGYEWDVHRNWRLRVEPFVRLPVREVGWANVRLYSAGSFISVNYNL